MRLYIFLTLFFFTGSSFLISHHSCNAFTTKTVSDFTLHRLSNGRVFVSWHTTDDLNHVTYELLRKHTMRDSFIRLAIVEPESREDNTADYSFMDINNFSDSSYYCLKKTNIDGVIFYSITKGIAGIAKER